MSETQAAPSSPSPGCSAHQQSEEVSSPVSLNHYDVIILGTGVTESIVAGALSQCGKSVLHLDGNSYYGGMGSAFNLKGLLEWAVGIMTENVLSDCFGTLQEFKSYHAQTYSDISLAFSIPCPYANYETLSDKTKVAITGLLDGPGCTRATFKEVERIITEALKEKSLSENSTSQSNTDAANTNTANDGLSGDALLICSTLHAVKIFHERCSTKKSHLCTSPLDINISTSGSLGSTLYGITELVDNALSRHFNIDLTPKLVACRGPLIDALVSSRVSKYMEFKNVSGSWICAQNGSQGALFDKVPCSKEDVFVSKTVSLIEKRRIMKFLTFANGITNSSEGNDGGKMQEWYEEYKSRPLRVFLEEKFQIKGSLLLAILYSIARIDESEGDGEVNTFVGVERTRQYLSCLGRYGSGNSAFLCPLYGGASEIAQAFCRGCAVFGGTYMLNCHIFNIGYNLPQQPTTTKEGDNSNSHLPSDSRTTDGSENQKGWSVRYADGGNMLDGRTAKFTADNLVTSLDYVGLINGETSEYTNCVQNETEYVNRGIVITDMPMHGEEEVCETIFPPGSFAGNREHAIHALQVGYTTQNCPKGMYITYLTSKADGVPSEVLSGAVKTMFTAQDTTGGPPSESSSPSPSNETPAVAPNIANHPQIKFSLFFKQRVRRVVQPSDEETATGTLFLTSDPNRTVHTEDAVVEARKIFERLCPEQDFLVAPVDEEEE